MCPPSSVWSWSSRAAGRVLIDATEQRIVRPSDQEAQKDYYSGKKKMHTLKTQIVADAEHHIVAISEAVPGKKHDKKLSDELQTMERLPDGAEVRLDSGYQGVDKQVGTKDASQAETGSTETEPRLAVLLPFKKPKGGELTDEQKAFNRAISQVRVRIEHCIGWIKNWAIIATRFRCTHSIYTSILRTVCGLVNAQTLRWQQAKAANCA